MSTRNNSLARVGSARITRSVCLIGGACLTTLLAAASAAQDSPGLGVPATSEQIAAWALTVLPNGDGLPPGSGTARAGQTVFEQKCQACHGAGGQGGPNDQLAGGHGTLTSATPVKTIGSYWPYATTVFDYIRRAMPFTAPQSLTANETYALTAYLLYINDIIELDDVMNARTLPTVRMPNVDNFDWAYEPE